MIQLKHLNFGFEWTDIKHQTNFFEQRTDSNIVRTISTLFIYYRHSIFCPKPFGIPWTRAFRSPGHWWWGLIWGRVSFRFLHFGHWRCSDVVFTSSHESSSLRTVCTNRTWIWDPVCRKSQLTGMSTVLDYKQTYHESSSQPVGLGLKQKISNTASKRWGQGGHFNWWPPPPGQPLPLYPPLQLVNQSQKVEICYFDVSYTDFEDVRNFSNAILYLRHAKYLTV